MLMCVHGDARALQAALSVLDRTNAMPDDGGGGVGADASPHRNSHSEGMDDEADECGERQQLEQQPPPPRRIWFSTGRSRPSSGSPAPSRKAAAQATIAVVEQLVARWRKAIS